jgi:hypothetical protein
MDRAESKLYEVTQGNINEVLSPKFSITGQKRELKKSQDRKD